MNVKLSRLPVSSLGSLANSTISISHKPAYTVVSNHVLLQKLEETYTNYFAVFGKRAFSGMGTTVEEGDLYRDEPFRGIRSILKGFAKVSGYPFRQEAIDLLSIIDQLGGNIEKLDYASENEKMDKLISEYDKDENKAKLAKLNLTELYAALKTRHTDFKDLYFQQTEANATLHLQSSASALRNELAESLRNYLALVTAMKSIDGWAALYAELTEVAKTANNSVSVPDKTKSATPTT